MTDYIKDVTGEYIAVNMSSYEEDGRTFDNFKVLLVDYLTY
jgi:hypothetical protein